MEKAYCQSCAMPLTNPSDFGSNADGTPNADYCVYCYKEGAFTSECTMEEMIEFCAPLCVREGVYPDENTARAAMGQFFPALKRWSASGK